MKTKVGKILEITRSDIDELYGHDRAGEISWARNCYEIFREKEKAHLI